MAKSSRTRTNGQSSADSQGSDLTRLSAWMQRHQASRCTLGDVSPALVIEALDAALDAGVLVALGRTSDGGAIGCYVTENGQRHKAWAGNESELEELFTQLRDAYAD